MGTVVRRGFWGLLVALLAIALTWQATLSWCIRQTASWKFGYSLTFREIWFEGGALVLQNPQLRGHPSFQMDAKKISVGFWRTPKTIVLSSPRFYFPDGLPSNLLSSSDANRNISLIIEDGVIDLGGDCPFHAHFTWRDRQLHLESGRDATLSLSFEQDQKILFHFEQLPLAPFANLMNFAQVAPSHGTLSGFLHLGQNKSLGRLQIDDLGWISKSRNMAGGAEKVEWEGESDCGIKAFDWEKLRRMHLRLKGSFAMSKTSRLDSLDGLFFFNKGVGFRWELEGKEFSWNGKSFLRNDGSQWFKSDLEFAGSGAHLDMEKSAEESTWSLVLNKGSADLFRLISDFYPEANWPCQLRGGELSAKLSCKEQRGQILEWAVNSLSGKELNLGVANWEFCCSSAEGSLACKENVEQFDANLTLAKGRISAPRIEASDLNAQIRIEQGEILSGAASTLCNGLQTEALFSGSLKESLIDVRARGAWDHFAEATGIQAKGALNEILDAALLLKGNWNCFLAALQVPLQNGEAIEGCAVVEGMDVREVMIEARRFDIARLESFSGLDLAGIADVRVNYGDSKWKVQLDGEDLLIRSQEGSFWVPALKLIGQLNEEGHWSAAVEKIEGEIALLGEAIPFAGSLVWEDNLLSARVLEANAAGIDFAGVWLLSLDDNYAFSFESNQMKGPLDELARLCGLDLKGDFECEKGFLSGNLFEPPKEWLWNLKASVSNFSHGLICEAKALFEADSLKGLLSCSQLCGKVLVGESFFEVRGDVQSKKKAWQFDLRLEDRFRDLARLSGSVTRDSAIRVTFNKKSHFLGSPLQVRSCTLNNSLEMSLDLPFKSLSATERSLIKVDKRFASLLELPLTGSLVFDLSLGVDNCKICVHGKELFWNERPLPFHVEVERKDSNWKVACLQLDQFRSEMLLSLHEERWRIESGAVRMQNGMEAAVSGFIGPGVQCELTLEALHVDFEQARLHETHSVQGVVKGSGFLNVGLTDDLHYELDLDLSLSPLKVGEMQIDNSGPLQLHFSKRQGLLIRGLDLQVQKPGDASWLYSRIGLMQYDPAKSRWFLHHSHLKLPVDAFSLLHRKLGENHPMAMFLKSLDPQNDLECSTELSFNNDFSSISCSMKEGFIPFLGAVRHLQNVELFCSRGDVNLEFHTLHQGHSLKIGACVDLERLAGNLILEDEESLLSPEERPMALQWELHPEQGLLVHSIEGSFGGVDASFHREVRETGSSLIGTAKIDFSGLSDLLPARIRKVFQELKMGQGYELKGRLFYGPNWSDAVFKGLLSGKNCHLFGWQIRSFLSQIEAGTSLVRLFEVKASDAAGIMKIDEIVMSQKEEDPWQISMPFFQLLEFRPSLLQRIGREVDPVGPLVVREITMTQFKGELEESQTYTAKGSLSFINSFKREHSVFDIPADVLGRIFGLDLELLIPVKGSLTFELKDGKFWLDELKDAYSEGKRSKFFLVKEGISPTVDLDGNVSILVKMKQYVLFKFTENFLLSIEGTLENPSYSLQKKSRVQKLSG